MSDVPSSTTNFVFLYVLKSQGLFEILQDCNNYKLASWLRKPLISFSVYLPLNCYVLLEIAFV